MSVVDPDQAAVLAALRRIGGGVMVPELAYKTGLSRAVVVEALCGLEERGLAAPWSWQAVNDPDLAA